MVTIHLLLVFTPEQVHAIAKKYNYTEISHNANSRVISFRKGTSRINVYYTTGTVGTCLNHPTKGKTQLFRRNVTLAQLDTIFANPRTHTGKGYYQRSKASQEWKSGTEFMTDMARRWEYVATAADLIDGDVTVLPLLVEAMNRISHMLWERGTVPSMDNLLYDCGSLSGIMTMTLKVADGFGAVGACSETDARKVLQEGGPRPELEYLECFAGCGNLQPFLNANHDTLVSVEDMLCSLPIRLRREVCNWLIGLRRCGYVLVDEYFSYSCSQNVLALHEEYSQTYYTKNHLAQVCKIHGLVAEKEE